MIENTDPLLNALGMEELATPEAYEQRVRQLNDRDETLDLTREILISTLDRTRLCLLASQLFGLNPSSITDEELQRRFVSFSGLQWLREHLPQTGLLFAGGLEGESLFRRIEELRVRTSSILVLQRAEEQKPDTGKWNFDLIRERQKSDAAHLEQSEQ